jgi:hypothetical protein
MLKAESQLVADPDEVSLDLPRAGEGCLDMRRYVLTLGAIAPIAADSSYGFRPGRTTATLYKEIIGSFRRSC